MLLTRLNKALALAATIPSEHFLIEGGVDNSVINSANGLQSISVRVEESLPTIMLPNEARMFLSKLDQADLEVERALVIRHATGVASFPIIDKSMFQDVLPINPENSFVLESSDELRKALANTMHVPNKDDAIHPGIWFSPTGVFATDGRQVVKYFLEVPQVFQLPLHAAAAVALMEGKVTVETTDSLVRFKTKNLSYTTVLHPGSVLPAFDKYLSRTQAISFTIQTKTLLDAIKRVTAAIPKDQEKVVTFELGEELTLKSDRGYEVLPVQTLPHVGKFDGPRLSGLLSKIEEKEIRVEMNPGISFNTDKFRVFVMGVAA